MKIQNSTALVTGANRGIGRELVKALLAQGAKKVYATARDVASLETIVALDPKRVVPVRLDVTQSAQIEEAAHIAPNVTLLFNNAGALNFGNILEVPMEDITRQFATNFYGKLQMARAFAPALERNGGGIVNVLTLVAFASMPGLATYNASKAAAWSMTQSLRATLAAKHVQVFGVFPGAVDTDMTAGIEMPKTPPAEIATAILAGIEADEEDVFPDAMSTQLYAAWKQDHKAVERQFATM
ncbi:MAG TPA: SDR family oxidoreductase [Steroidobacteraceae bacterium]|nr:SDR family oxidoreductase [Steroidobacteraceae bacterium]